MTRSAATQPARRGRPAVSAARRWLIIPLLLAVLGAVAGYVAGSASRASAEALLLVRTANNTDTVSATKTAALELDTRDTFVAAAEQTGGNVNDLRSRAKISTVPNSNIVSVTITAPTTAQAVEDATAVARAGVAAGPSRTPEALSQLTQSTRDLISSDSLSNASAERARVARLGDALGASQSALVTDANQIQLLQEGEPSSQLPSSPVLALVGGIAGALVGLAIALLLGARRGTIKSSRELTELYPRAAVITSSDLRQALAMEPDARTVIVAGAPGAPLDGVTETVRETLHEATGKKVVVSDNLFHAPVNEPANGHVNLVATTLSETVLRRTSRDGNSVLIVPVQPKVTKLNAVDEYASRLADRSYLLVDDRGPEWH